MAEEDRDGVALLPIQPPYVEAILEGRKRVEFRRRGFGRPVRHVVVYSTSPVQRIVAFFRVSEIREASPHELWERYWKVGGIAEDVFNAYYQGAQKGIAIEIDEVFTLKTPLPLKSLCETLSVPQSFSYLSDLLFQQVVHTYRQDRRGFPDLASFRESLCVSSHLGNTIVEMREEERD